MILLTVTWTIENIKFCNKKKKNVFIDRNRGKQLDGPGWEKDLVESVKSSVFEEVVHGLHCLRGPWRSSLATGPRRSRSREQTQPHMKSLRPYSGEQLAPQQQIKLVSKFDLDFTWLQFITDHLIKAVFRFTGILANQFRNC